MTQDMSINGRLHRIHYDMQDYYRVVEATRAITEDPHTSSWSIRIRAPVTKYGPPIPKHIIGIGKTLEDALTHAETQARVFLQERCTRRVHTLNTELRILTQRLNNIRAERAFLLDTY